MLPVVGTKPVMPSMNVVLPAPFGPMSPTSLPSSTVKSTRVDGAEAAEGDAHVGGAQQSLMSAPPRRRRRPPVAVGSVRVFAAEARRER